MKKLVLLLIFIINISSNADNSINIKKVKSDNLNKVKKNKNFTSNIISKKNNNDNIQQQTKNDNSNSSNKKEDNVIINNNESIEKNNESSSNENNESNESNKSSKDDKNLFLKLKNSFEDIVTVKTSITNTSFEQVRDIPKNEKNITFQLKIGGLFDFQYGHLSANSIYGKSDLNYANGLGFYPQMRYNGGYLSTWQDFNLRAKIDIAPEIKFKNFKFGVMFAVPLVKNYDSDPKTASQEYLYIDLDYVKFELGSAFSAASKMRIDPSKIASGTGGVYGDWWRYSMTAIFNSSGSTLDALNYGFSPVFMIYPTLPNEAGFTSGNVLGSGYSGNLPLTAANIQYGYVTQGLPTQGARSNKISIYTKRMKGIQIGFSYSPDTNNTGFMNRTILNTGYLFGGIRNYISFGINYKEQITNLIGVGLSFTFEHGKYYGPTSVTGGDLSTTGVLDKRDLNAFAVGAMLIYKNFAFSYAYNDWLNSLTPYSYKNPFGYTNIYNGQHSYSHVGGFSANFGNMNFSIQYMYSIYQGNEANVLSIGTDYILASLKYIRIEPYVEYNFVVLKPNSFTLTTTDPSVYQAVKKTGHIFIMGMRFRF